jgi:DNA-binding transcriptional MerR regulator
MPTRSTQPREHPADRFTIHDLIAEFAVTARTLRFYEEKGLLAPTREGDGEAARRIYSRRDRARLKLVLMGKRVGFSLEETREMLDLYDPADKGVAQARAALDAFDAKIAELEARRTDIDSAIAELSHAREVVRVRAARADASSAA